jgi:hypothetical protein
LDFVHDHLGCLLTIPFCLFLPPPFYPLLLFFILLPVAFFSFTYSSIGLLSLSLSLFFLLYPLSSFSLPFFTHYLNSLPHFFKINMLHIFKGLIALAHSIELQPN